MHKHDNNGKRPNLSAVARSSKVTKHFVTKVESELEQYGFVLSPSMLKEKHSKEAIGPGSRTLDEVDESILVALYYSDASQTVHTSYQQRLEMLTGTKASERTISHFFHEALLYKANLQKPNLVPIDKFTVIFVRRGKKLADAVRTMEPVECQ